MVEGELKRCCNTYCTEGMVMMNDKMEAGEHVVEFQHITGQDKLQEVKQLLTEYAESLNIDLAFQNFETELKELPGKYCPPDGALILVTVDGNASGCVALRRISDDICEMKRLYVRDAYRGLGIGRKLVAMVIEEAARLGYRYIRLDTLPTMEKALELYRASGFYEIEPYVFNPIKGTRFLELKLQ